MNKLAEHHQAPFNIEIPDVLVRQRANETTQGKIIKDEKTNAQPS